MSLYCVFLIGTQGFAGDFVFSRSALGGSKSLDALGGHSGAILIGNVRQQKPVIPARFVLFDFKQNLRRWPVLAGDISRSPPAAARSNNLFLQ